MMGFGAPTPPAGGGSGGPAVDQVARDELAKRASSICVANVVSHTLGQTTEKPMLAAWTVVEKTGVFADDNPGDDGRVIIPPGVSRVAVTVGSLHAGNTTGNRFHLAKLYDSENTLKLNNISYSRRVAPAQSIADSMQQNREIIDVEPGDYLIPYAANTQSGGILAVIASYPRAGNFILVEVIE